MTLDKGKKQKLKDRTCGTRQLEEKCGMSAPEKLAMLKSKEKRKRFEEEKTYMRSEEAKNGHETTSVWPSDNGRTYPCTPSPDQQSQPSPTGSRFSCVW